LCDGSTVPRSEGNGVITVSDLRGEFVIGAGGNHALGATGGSVSPVAPVSVAGGHSHSASTDAHSRRGGTCVGDFSGDQMPPQTHSTVVPNVYAAGFSAGLRTSSLRLYLANSETSAIGSGNPHDRPMLTEKSSISP
jgi:hypothetical protein